MVYSKSFKYRKDFSMRMLYVLQLLCRIQYVNLM